MIFEEFDDVIFPAYQIQEINDISNIIWKCFYDQIKARIFKYLKYYEYLELFQDMLLFFDFNNEFHVLIII